MNFHKKIVIVFATFWYQELGFFCCNKDVLKGTQLKLIGDQVCLTECILSPISNVVIVLHKMLKVGTL